MRQPGRMNGATALLCAIAASLPLSACGSIADSGVGSTLGNMIAFNSATPRAHTELKPGEIEVNCPAVLIMDGKSAYRAYASAEQTNENVKVQYSFGDLARECIASEGKIAMRVGISGFVLAGPKGGPGNFQVPVRVMIRRDATLQPAVEKTYRVDAALSNGNLQAPFSLVTEPLEVPLVSTDAAQDYSILIGFDATPEKPQKPAKGGKPARRAAAH